ncbi:MAG: Rpn family recombination-promoting nuclease/putative transposase [Coleofasciculus chthonoplastes F3-SA18-01]|uniref:Rpn family recombination-promoting nuclease/putative transposase n=1 Tax=Coleofasciculus chthonoplastes TaxID=64178 RepID=UPI0032F27EF3
MKTDTIFYSLFKEFPSIFFELINQSTEQAATYQFTSREIKQLSFRVDGLFLPKNKASNQPFYLIEVQFQPDEDLYYRLFAELFIFLRQYKPPHPWRVVVIYPTRRIEREQPLQFRELFSRVQRIYLDELGDVASDSLGVKIVKLVMETEQTAPEMARQLIDQAQVEITDETRKRDLIDLIETIIVYKLPQKSRQEIEAMLGLSELKQTKVYQEAKQEGLTEGRQEGEFKAKLTAIPRMLQFGLSLEQIAQLQDLPVDVVQQTSHLFHQQNVAAFVELLHHQRSLFSPQDLAELAFLIQPLPDKIEDLSCAIAQWCKQEGNAAQLMAWRQIRSGLLSAMVEKLLGRNSDTQETPSVSVNKAMVQNAVESGESFE